MAGSQAVLTFFFFFTEKAFPVIFTPSHLSSSTKIPPVSKYAVPMDGADRLAKACPRGKTSCVHRTSVLFYKMRRSTETMSKRLPRGH